MTLQHKSISAELHALCACLVSMFVRAVPEIPACMEGTEATEGTICAICFVAICLARARH